MPRVRAFAYPSCGDARPYFADWLGDACRSVDFAFFFATFEYKLAIAHSAHCVGTVYPFRMMFSACAAGSVIQF